MANKIELILSIDWTPQDKCDSLKARNLKGKASEKMDSCSSYLDEIS